jgi:hypothetical protein
MPDQAIAQHNDSARSSINSLKEVVTIVTGVTITSAIVMLLTGGNYSQVKGLDDLNIRSLMLFFLLIANIIRFYHGNMRHLDETSMAASGAHHTKDVRQMHQKFFGVDFLVIFCQSVTLATMSFYINRGTEFLGLFTFLLCLDIIWVFAALQYTDNPEVFKYQKQWLLSNLIALILLLVALVVSASDKGNIQSVNYVRAGIIAVNTASDYWISWRFYFPYMNHTSPDIKERELVRSGERE